MPGAIPNIYYQIAAPLTPQKGDFWFDGSNLNFRTDGGWLAVAISAVPFDALSANVVTLSQTVSAMSQTISAISNSVSVLSNSVSVLSNAVSVISQAVSVISQQVSVMSTTLSNLGSVVTVAISNTLSVLSNQASVLSAGLGTVQMKVVQGNQAQFSATAVKLSGLSVSCAASGLYQLDGILMYSVSSTGAYTFGMSVAGGLTFTNLAGVWYAMTSAQTGAFTSAVAVVAGFTTATPQQLSAAVGTAGVVVMARLDAIANVNAAGTLQLKASAVTGADTTLLKGSFLRAFKVG